MKKKGIICIALFAIGLITLAIYKDIQFGKEQRIEKARKHAEFLKEIKLEQEIDIKLGPHNWPTSDEVLTPEEVRAAYKDIRDSCRAWGIKVYFTGDTILTPTKLNP